MAQNNYTGKRYKIAGTVPYDGFKIGDEFAELKNTFGDGDKGEKKFIRLETKHVRHPLDLLFTLDEVELVN